MRDATVSFIVDTWLKDPMDDGRRLVCAYGSEGANSGISYSVVVTGHARVLTKGLNHDTHPYMAISTKILAHCA